MTDRCKPRSCAGDATAELPPGGETGARKAGRPRKRVLSPPPQRKQGLGLRPAARALDLPISTLRKVIDSGRAVMFDDGSIDVESTRISIEERTDPTKRGARKPRTQVYDDGDPPEKLPPGRKTLAGPPEDAADIRDVRLRQMLAKADAMERSNALAAGDLVNRAEAEDAVFKMARNFRNSWQALPGRVYADVAAELGAEPEAVRRVLMRIIDDHLNASAMSVKSDADDVQ